MHWYQVATTWHGAVGPIDIARSRRPRPALDAELPGRPSRVAEKNSRVECVVTSRSRTVLHRVHDDPIDPASTKPGAVHPHRRNGDRRGATGCLRARDPVAPRLWPFPRAPSFRSMGWHDVLIVGGGFGGAFCARALEGYLGTRSERTLLVAPDNFLLFSPLLPEAASGTIEPRHAVIPLRELLSETELLIGHVSELDTDARKAMVTDVNGDTHDIEFGVAVLAPGSIPATFPISGLHENAVGFKTLADAIWLRNRLLHQLDAAEAATNFEHRRRLLTFTFVGGGYAGVEALAELESLARDALNHYPSLTRTDMRWVLVEAQESLLPGLHPKLASFTEGVLQERGIEVHLETRLESCVDHMIVLSGDRVAPYSSDTIVWTAGQRPHSAVEAWGLPVDDSGFVPVDDHLRVSGRDDLFCIGDVAAVPDPEGGIAPNTAQHALRQAAVAATNVAAFYGINEPTPFTYKTRGLAVTLGKWQGTAQVKHWTFTGPIAWWMGRSYHLLMMPGLGRKLRVVSDWTMSLLFPRDVAQLGQLGTPTPLQ